MKMLKLILPATAILLFAGQAAAQSDDVDEAQRQKLEAQRVEMEARKAEYSERLREA